MLGKSVFIVGAKRTPLGNFGGKLKGFSATDLGAHAAAAAMKHAGVAPSKIDETIMGMVGTSSLDAAYMSRHVALRAGVPISAPSLNINRLCGSGFEAVCLGAESIMLGRASVTLCGGTENMSASPMVIDGIAARHGVALGKGMIAQDSLWAALTDSLAKMKMGDTAEALGAKYGITRAQCDEFGLRSQNLYQKAFEAGVFKAEIEPMSVKGRKGPELVSADESPRLNCVLADLEKLKPVFKPEGGLVTAGSASGISDGAACLIVASEEAIKANGMNKPLARLVAWSRVGCDPSIMGIGPVEAIRKALGAAKLTLADMDLVEINEAFAAQYLACEKELGLDRNKANLNGGAIAMGHPLGASGARILTHLTHELHRTNKKYAIGAACIGGGQGIAVILEKC